MHKSKCIKANEQQQQPKQQQKTAEQQLNNPQKPFAKKSFLAHTYSTTNILRICEDARGIGKKFLISAVYSFGIATPTLFSHLTHRPNLPSLDWREGSR